MANYNCSDSTINAYGAGDYGTCATTGSVGAPNTGVFEQVLGSGTFTIIVPLAAAIVVVVIASAVMRLRKKSAAKS
jgi:hypothetical protein